MRTAPLVFVSVILGCGGSTPATAPKTAPVVSAESGGSLPVTATGTQTEGAKRRSQGPTDSARTDNAADDKEATDKEATDKAAGDTEAECVALTDEVNSSVEQLETNVNVAPNATNILEPYRAIAKAMDEARLKLSKIYFRDARLRDLAKEYQQMALDIANGARAVIEAAERRDLANLEKALKDLEKAVNTEDPLVDAINKYCHGE